MLGAGNGTLGYVVRCADRRCSWSPLFALWHGQKIYLQRVQTPKVVRDSRVASCKSLTCQLCLRSGLFDLTEYIDSEDAPALKSAFADSMQTTQELITTFMQIGTKSQPAALHDRAYQDCQKAQNEVCVLRRSQFNIRLTNSLTVSSSEIRDIFSTKATASIRRTESAIPCRPCSCRNAGRSLAKQDCPSFASAFSGREAGLENGRI